MSDSLDDLPQPEYEGRVPVDDLDTDGDNPNEMTDEQFGLLKDRMRQNGWLGGPVVTDTDGLIADGEHRWRAADAIGLEEVPVRQFDIDDAERRLWRQELNKIHGEHDTKRDALEYDYLLDAGKADEVHELTQAADEDLDELLAEIKMETSASPAYEYDPDHNVYFEDCVEGMRERLDDDSVDCVITDPPYGAEVDVTQAPGVDAEAYRGTVENDGFEDAMALNDAFLSVVRDKLSSDGHLYMFTGATFLPDILPIVEKNDFDVRNVLVWSKPPVIPYKNGGKPNYMFGFEMVVFATPGDGHARSLNKIKPDVFEYSTDNKKSKGGHSHPTQKPVALISDFMENSTREGDRILDPFMGSGTTAVAAIQNDREYVGFEVDADNYRDVIERRIGEAKRQRDAEVNAADD